MKRHKARLIKNLDPAFLIPKLKSLRKSNHFSNYGEQKIIEKYIKQFELNPRKHSIVDIGAGDGIRFSNTYSLFKNGWRGIGFEFDGKQAAKLANAYKYFPNAFASRCKITSENVVNLLKSYDIEKDFGILSLDIDGNDYWVLDALLLEYRPRLIVSEYNEKIPPPIKFVVNNNPDFTLRHHFYGYSIAKLKDLLEKHNYVLLEIEYNNVFIAPAELESAQPVKIEQAYRDGYLDRANRREKFAANENMEILNRLSAAEAIEFLNNFYEEFKNEYQIGLE